MKVQRYAVPSSVFFVACAFRLSADLGGPLFNDAGLEASSGDATSVPDEAADEHSSVLAEVGAVSTDEASPGWPSATEASTASNSDATASISGDAGPPDGLPPPSTGAGLQIVTPPNAYVLQPGQELLQNFCTTVSQDVEVGGFDGWMSEGGHHLFVYLQTASATPSTCTPGTAPRIYVYSPSVLSAPAALPDGIGLPLAKNTQIVEVMHFINPYSSVLYPQSKLNILSPSHVQYEAGIMLGASSGPVVVPPATAAGPGSQIVSGSCTVPAGSKFFLLTAYGDGPILGAFGATNSVATMAVVSGGNSTELLSTGRDAGQSLLEVTVAQYAAPNFLATGAGDSLTYQCNFSNSASIPTMVGTSSNACTAVGLYFPAGTAQCQ